MSVNGSATLSSVSDNADGTYTATITNNTVETVRVLLLVVASLACIVIVEVVVPSVLTLYELASKVDFFAAIAAATQADSDTRSEIQTLVNDAPGLAAAKKSTLEASSYSVNTDGTTTSTITMQALVFG
jgi:cytochrome c-type biogenesis protein CcmE